MIENAENYSVVRSKAISFIGISHKSSGRVRDFLLRSGIDQSLAAQVVDTLIIDGYIDDLRVARGIVSTRQGKKTESTSRLRQRLLAYGISDQAVYDLTEELPVDSITIDNLVNEKYRIVDLSSFDSDELNSWKMSTLRFLSSRGFSSNLSLSAINKFIARNEKY
jgi:SOS response regulatory protein OraA/RecX